ncbi:MAG: hypothetical protein M1813_008178 [Trichoglossum hirsutum]|nr:MAG: hypothetical protein M1813_008178 [Trichoglossum hirsutum]
MPIGSTVDVIGTIKLLTELRKAVQDGAGSSAEYQELISMFYTLENALLLAKRVEVEGTEKTALQQAISKCQHLIDKFIHRIQKYQPSLRSQGSSSALVDTFRKIQWRLCKTEDVKKFRSELSTHIESINMLLASVQMYDLSMP